MVALYVVHVALTSFVMFTPVAYMRAKVNTNETWCELQYSQKHSEPTISGSAGNRVSLQLQPETIVEDLMLRYAHLTPHMLTTEARITCTCIVVCSRHPSSGIAARCNRLRTHTTAFCSLPTNTCAQYATQHAQRIMPRCGSLYEDHVFSITCWRLEYSNCPRSSWHSRRRTAVSSQAHLQGFQVPVFSTTRVCSSNIDCSLLTDCFL